MSEKEKTLRKISVVVPEAKKEDKESYTVEELYVEYYKPLQRRFAKVTGTHEDGEDLTQEVFERLIKYWDRAQKHKIEAVIATICHNVLYDWRNRHFNRVPTVNVDDILDYDCSDNGITDPFRTLVNERVFDQVMEAMSLLTEQQQTIFNMYHVQSMDTKEIVDELGCGMSSVYSALNAARKLINQLYEKPELEGEHHG